MIKTRAISNPTYYVDALNGEFADYAFNEERAEEFRGRWREAAFGATVQDALDVEIGTGNGYFFAHQSSTHTDRLLLGIEIKFKPLIQSIRRALKLNVKNARVARFNASFLENIFDEQEINNVFIHHPDPWNKNSKHKRRLMKSDFLKKLYTLQKPGSFLEFKTDSQDYFFWALEEFKNSSYKLERYSEDLHGSDWRDENFITHFEKIYMEKGQPIYYLRALRE
ncbi:MAG: tRNA (guanosine(46)-N7)-methyltransferase TrmB [Bdellovibrionales bacterium]|nr:tRNA (guanosine(46)-N7)-methyltransferase TrmB [Bdellovibrionales bacterium]